MCAICNGGKVEDVKHFVLECVKFEQDRCWFLDRVKGIVGEEEWMNGFEEGDDDSRVSLYYQGEEWT